MDTIQPESHRPRVIATNRAPEPFTRSPWWDEPLFSVVWAAVMAFPGVSELGSIDHLRAPFEDALRRAEPVLVERLHPEDQSGILGYALARELGVWLVGEAMLEPGAPRFGPFFRQRIWLDDSGEVCLDLGWPGNCKDHIASVLDRMFCGNHKARNRYIEDIQDWIWRETRDANLWTSLSRYMVKHNG